MKTRLCKLIALAALLAVAGCATVAPDYAREKRQADQIAPALAAGEAITLLTTSGHRFLGALKPAAQPRAGLLLVHGVGGHPDFGVIGDLRLALAQRGYTTLSIQMPMLAPDAKSEDYVPLFAEAGERIAAGLAELRARGIRQVAIVSHGMGARMVGDFIARRADMSLMAWVPMSVSNGQLGAPGSLADVHFPVFDVFAEQDTEAVIRGARARAGLLRSIKGAKQAVVYGTDHYYGQKGAEVAALLDQMLTPLVR